MNRNYVKANYADHNAFREQERAVGLCIDCGNPTAQRGSSKSLWPEA